MSLDTLSVSASAPNRKFSFLTRSAVYTTSQVASLFGTSSPEIAARVRRRQLHALPGFERPYRFSRTYIDSLLSTSQH